ncbi:hypothetical protein JHK85_006669 [Glycine max]|nr:hypothetical protein JHK85_006669 [Glycine max]
MICDMILFYGGAGTSGGGNDKSIVNHAAQIAHIPNQNATSQQQFQTQQRKMRILGGNLELEPLRNINVQPLAQAMVNESTGATNVAYGDGGSAMQLYAKECSKLLLHVLKRGPSQKNDEVVTSIGDEKEAEDFCVMAQEEEKMKLLLQIWYTYLNSDFKKGGWSLEEDKLLCEKTWVVQSLRLEPTIVKEQYLQRLMGEVEAKLNISLGKEGSNIPINCKVDSYRCQLIVMEIFVVVLGILWGVRGALVKAEFNNGGNVDKLWFASMVGPIGVWIRWFLASLNGRGLGKPGFFKWIQLMI